MYKSALAVQALGDPPTYRIHQWLMPDPLRRVNVFTMTPSFLGPLMSHRSLKLWMRGVSLSVSPSPSLPPPLPPTYPLTYLFLEVGGWVREQGRCILEQPYVRTRQKPRGEPNLSSSMRFRVPWYRSGSHRWMKTEAPPGISMSMLWKNRAPSTISPGDRPSASSK